MPVQVRLRAPILCNCKFPLMKRVSSRQNAYFKLAHKLAESARERSKAGKLLLDGTRLIRAYTDQFGFDDVTLLLSEAGAAREDVRKLVGASNPNNVYQLADDLFAEITQVYTGKYNFFYSSRCQVPNISQYIFYIVAAAFTPGHRYGAKRTVIIAAVLHF